MHIEAFLKVHASGVGVKHGVFGRGLFEWLNLEVIYISHSGAYILSDLNPILGLAKFPCVLEWRSRLRVHVRREVEEIHTHL